MKRKFFILTLLSVFLVSTTGLPLGLHYCSIKGLTFASTCTKHKALNEAHSCCNNNTDQNPVKITVSQPVNCCMFKVVVGSSTDQFVTINNDLSFVKNLKTVIPLFSNVYEAPAITKQFDYTSSSPPPLSENQIYLINSVLII
jgi:hypothetical protein